MAKNNKNTNNIIMIFCVVYFWNTVHTVRHHYNMHSSCVFVETETRWDFIPPRQSTNDTEYYIIPIQTDVR